MGDEWSRLAGTDGAKGLSHCDTYFLWRLNRNLPRHNLPDSSVFCFSNQDCYVVVATNLKSNSIHWGINHGLAD